MREAPLANYLPIGVDQGKRDISKILRGSLKFIGLMHLVNYIVI